MHQLKRHARQRGFTLAELAIVLIIITILAGALLVPIGGQIERRQRMQTETALDRLEAALIGFAILNKRLPCIAVEDSTSPDYGSEDTSCPSKEGILPWRTLGVPPNDAWNSLWRYRVDANFAAPFSTGTSTTGIITVEDRYGQGLTVASKSAVALIYSAGADREPNGKNKAAPPPYEQGEPTTTFDDMVKWFGRPLLIARMAEAGVF